MEYRGAGLSRDSSGQPWDYYLQASAPAAVGMYFYMYLTNVRLAWSADVPAPPFIQDAILSHP